ncbi:hypothetical protein [Nocardia carnea]|uniref:hypothetical protein n=1 Tax=Nocardia carnea TaxID=37328 RepID=UPI002457D00F|nr:hypothetical protein [Nocardia carnea]
MRTTTYRPARNQRLADALTLRHLYGRTVIRPSLTIELNEQAAGTHFRTGRTNVVYGLSRGALTNRGQMAITVTHGRATLAYTSDQANGPAARIVHGDILNIGGHLYTVHCPAGYRETMPALHRISTPRPAPPPGRAALFDGEAVTRPEGNRHTMGNLPIGTHVTYRDRRGIVDRYVNEKPVIAWDEGNGYTSESAHDADELTPDSPVHECGPDCTPENCEQDRARYTEQREAIDQAHRNALTAHQHWRHIADIFTELRAHGMAGLVDLPTIDDWYEDSALGAPFDTEELRAELAALSGPITKAWTLAVLYNERAEEYAEWLTENLA